MRSVKGDLSSEYPIQRKVQYSFTLQNRNNRVIEKADFWTYAPVRQTATQRTDKLEVSHPYELIEDELGNQVLHFIFKNFPPYASKIITIKAYLELSEIPKPYLTKDPSSYLKREKFVESDEPVIVEVAGKLKTSTAHDTAENIFHWVANNIKYSGYVRNERGALYALQNKQGDCTEFTDLFVAFSRANNIPARGIGGYVADKNTILKPVEYHNWAEFYDGSTWKIADPQKKVFAENQSQYIAMRIIGESLNNPMGGFNRFRFMGEGLTAKMNR